MMAASVPADTLFHALRLDCLLDAQVGMGVQHRSRSKLSPPEAPKSDGSEEPKVSQAAVCFSATPVHPHLTTSGCCGAAPACMSMCLQCSPGWQTETETGDAQRTRVTSCPGVYCHHCGVIHFHHPPPS